MKKILFVLVLAAFRLAAAEAQSVEAFRSGPRWRGFNLLEKFHKAWSNGPFREEDFRMIAELGFNFVRLPMDYRVWCRDGNPRKFDGKVLQEIDQAVAWGREYGLHVSLNFHRGPGFSVAEPAEPASLWTDRRMQALFVRHWEMFAKRYKGIPSRELSFNLLNEPHGDDSVRAAYVNIVRRTVRAIRKIDPQRLVISDGFGYGRGFLEELRDLEIVQAGRGYDPFQLSHYKASWAGGSSDWAVPVWPPRRILSQYLYGPAKPEFQSPVEIRAVFPAGTRVRITVRQVSDASRLVVRADGRSVLDREFKPGPGAGEWKRVVYAAEWNIYQNIYDREYEAVIPSAAKRLVIENTEGDWMTLGKIELVFPDGRSVSLRPDNADWGGRQTVSVLESDGSLRVLDDAGPDAKVWLKEEVFGPWISAQERGDAVFIGEWGAYKHTPHDVVLRWMEDCLSVWQETGLGWALWNFRGAFGVLDSERSDVVYEDWNGRKLDRKMLELLQRY